MSRLTAAIAITLAFAFLGWAVGGVTVGGAVAGFLVAFLLFYGIGPAALAVLFAVFAMTWVTTRLGRARKQRLGIAERRHGRRTAGQVLANIGVSGAFAGLVLIRSRVPHISPVLGDVGLLTAAMAALAEAAADTSSSECGEAFSDTALLVLRLRRVPAGTDGAVTVVGSLAGIAASVLVASIAAVLHVLPSSGAAIVAISGIIGTLVDTTLGATLERRGILNNNGVNFCSTLSAALIALLIAMQ